MVMAMIVAIHVIPVLSPLLFHFLVQQAKRGLANSINEKNVLSKEVQKITTAHLELQEQHNELSRLHCVYYLLCFVHMLVYAALYLRALFYMMYLIC